MSYLEKIARCNRANLQRYLPLSLDGYAVGWVRREHVPVLTSWLQGDSEQLMRLELNSEQGNVSSRNGLLADVVSRIHEEGIIRSPLGEMYPVCIPGRDEVIAVVDRTAASFFGIRCYGQHINGYVRKGGQLSMWLGRRAADRYIEAGKLDQIVAGGFPHGISLQENLIKECYEEAGIGLTLAGNARAVGTVSYFAESGIGLKPDTLFVYDLELPPDFQPVCTDGEVEAFHLLAIEEVAELVRETDDFKLNCNLVVIDFLVRHGLIQDSEPDYTDIVTGLHSVLPAF